MPLNDDLERKFNEKIRCPWPGPRPLSSDSPEGSLVGRAGAISIMLKFVRDSDVLVVTGASGVGKTSLLNAGLMPALHRTGFRVVTVKPGDAVNSKHDPLELLAYKVSNELGIAGEVNLDDLLEQIEDVFQDRIVVFLDQFEELLRYRRAPASRLLRGVESLATNTSIRFVLSIRSEFEHQLSGRLGIRPGAYRKTRYEVPELTNPVEFSSIISSANEVFPGTIDVDLVNRIVAIWKAAVEADEDVGLLDFQAFLFCLWLRRTPDDRVDNSALDGFERDVDGRYKGQNILTAAIPEAVRQSVISALDVAKDLTESQQLNTLQASSAIMCVRELSRYLGSGSYKIANVRRRLAQITLSGMAHQLSESQISFAAPPFRKLEHQADTKSPANDLSWLSSSRADYGLVDDLHEGWPWLEDRKNLTSGPVLGRRWEVALFEYYRSFILGLKLLGAAGVIRTAPITPDEQAVTLIHDRFSVGLQLWRESLAQDLADVAARPISTDGGYFEVQEIGSLRTVANLRWLHGTFAGKIRNTIFLNCDFSGTRFDSCEFDGVAFVNCILDDVLVQSGCILGGPSFEAKQLNNQKLGSLPTFRVAADHSYISSLGWYEGRTDTADCLLSLTGGMPAVTAIGDNCLSAQLISPELHGVSIYGGRISGFKIRQCDFRTDGWLRLSGVAGTSIEFADQSNLRLEILGSALRGFAVTCPMDKQPEPKTPSIEIHADNSILVDVWLGRGFVGEADISNCRVWHLHNASSYFHATIRGSGYHSVVNVANIVDSSEDGFHLNDLGDMVGFVEEVSNTIDFRDHPVDRELAAIREWRRRGQAGAKQ